MKRRIFAVCLLAVASIGSAQGFRPAPRSTPRTHQSIVVQPPCDPAKLIDLLDEFYSDPPPSGLDPEYCAPRTCEARLKAQKYSRDARLLQSIDLMRQACRSYFPS